MIIQVRGNPQNRGTGERPLMCGDSGELPSPWGRWQWRGRRGAGGFVLPHADLSMISQQREVLAAQLFRPLKAELVHESLAALPGFLTDGPARGNGLFQNGAHRRVHGAQEEL